MESLGLTLEAWRTIGVWFSAIGTIFLAAASLWLATRDRRLMLRIRADRRVMSQDAAGRPFSAVREVAERLGPAGVDVIEIQVTNMGHRAAIVTGTYWRVPWVFRKKTLGTAMYQVSPVNDFTDNLPWRLGDGQSSRQVYKEEEFKKLNSDQWQRLAKGVRWKWAAMRFMKVGAVTTIGKVVESRLSPELVKFFRELIRKAVSKT